MHTTATKPASAARDAEYQVVWSGATGWVGADARGVLLPAYDSRAVFAYQDKLRAYRPHAEARDQGRMIRYSPEMRAAVQASYKRGLTLDVVSDQFGVPRATVHRMCQRPRSHRRKEGVKT
jgi:hypothetical protein